MEEFQSFETLLRRLNEARPRQHFVMSVDLSVPAAEIVRLLRVILPSAQKFYSVKTKINRPRPQKWTLYLRALDAEASGASLTTIARELLGRDGSDADDDRARAHDLLDAARSVRDKLTR